MSPRKRSGLKANLIRNALLSSERDQQGERGCVRVGVSLLVVMKFIAVQKDHCILRYVHPVVHKVFGGKVRHSEPKWRVGAQHLKGQTTCEEVETISFVAYLLNDCPDVRKALLVLSTRPIVSANHLVKLCMSTSSNFWMRYDESQKPQDNA